MKFRIKLAGQVMEIESIYPFAKEYCKEFLTEEEARFRIAITSEDIQKEQLLQSETLEQEDTCLNEAYLETLALYRKIAKELLQENILLVHGSAVALHGEGYLFTAKSGVGKSTHRSLWQAEFGEDLTVINDDKPLLRIAEDGVFLCGTPWNGKHREGNNVQVPLKAVALLRRSEENQIALADPVFAWQKMWIKVFRPREPQLMEKTLALTHELIQRIPFYDLGVNQEIEAARVAYKKMSE